MFKRPDTTYKVSRRIVERIVRDEANPLHRIACIIENDSTVLDVGAGNGLLGLVLAKLHKNVMIDAIEPNKAGVKEIEVPPYRRIYHGYLDNYRDELIKEKYDYIVLADIIEHLPDPSNLIKESMQLLSDEGKLIISVPNMAFGSIRLSLLQGRFDYVDSGLLERTHLRFFTLNSLLLFVDKLKLFCSKIIYLRRDFSSKGPKINISEFDYSTLEAVSNDPTSHIYQILLVLRRKHGEKPIIKKYGNIFELDRYLPKHIKKRLPKVSILIPTFNRVDYLKEAINSAVNQTYPNIEILVLDDCSTDETIDISKAYTDIKNVTFIRNEHNIGFINNWNKAVSLSSGEYIKIMGDDDMLENNCIAEQVKILNKHCNVGTVCCDYFIIDENGNMKNNNNSYRLFNKDTKEDGEKFIKNYLLGERRVGWPTSILFRKADFERVGDFDPDTGRAADIDMWCRILRSKNFYYLDQMLAYNRQFSGNLSKKLSRDGIDHFYDKTIRYIKTKEEYQGRKMKQTVKNIFIYSPLYPIYSKWKQKRELIKWGKKGRPVPPPHIEKQEVLKRYAKQYGLRTFVETGTYRGDMVEAMKNTFTRIYSIELGEDLYRRARKRFRRHKHIEIIHGDSGKVFKKLIPNLITPTLFWLDGHYSGSVTAKGEKDSPIYEELSHIFNNPEVGHVVVIDDARCFSSPDCQDYPSLSELKEFVLSARPDVCITVDNDSIRILPRSIESKKTYSDAKL